MVDDTLRPALLAAGRASIHAALAYIPSSGTVCMAFSDSTHARFRAESADLIALAGPADAPDSHRRFVSFADCPTTYAGPIAYVDAQGRSLNPKPPPGYVDPVTVVIELPEGWLPKPGERSISLTVQVGQGTGGTTYLCRLRAATARAAMQSSARDTDALGDAATCRGVAHWVH